MIENKIKEKLANLKDNIKKYSKVMVAFSGGVDSTFLLAVCAETLGKSNVTAATASSETYTKSELNFAKEIAAKIGVQHTIIETDELSDPVFLSNPKDRCYYCKKSFYSKLLEVSQSMNISIIVDGTNADDTLDYRPGRTAVQELGIISPLMEEGFSKEDIRILSKEMKLPTWNKAANPCLASRIPYGNVITKEKLEAIAKAEKFIRAMGFETIRVRHHDTIARIEILAHDLPRFMQDDIREQVNKYLKSLGFVWIAVDIEGYRTGSLNSVIK
jgi:pyridinium-3,5-biscarboxylic acid mononucleotide sulfurtransferase